MSIFMKYGSIVGEVTTPGLVGWIELNSFSWGASNSATNASSATGAAAGKVSVGDITIGKVVDAATVQLIKMALTGAETDGVIIQFDKQFYKDARGAVPGAAPGLPPVQTGQHARHVLFVELGRQPAERGLPRTIRAPGPADRKPQPHLRKTRHPVHGADWRPRRYLGREHLTRC